MKKISLVIIGLGLLFMTISSSTVPVDFLLLCTGLFYIVLGWGIYLHFSKKEKRKE